MEFEAHSAVFSLIYAISWAHFSASWSDHLSMPLEQSSCIVSMATLDLFRQSNIMIKKWFFWHSERATQCEFQMLRLPFKWSQCVFWHLVLNFNLCHFKMWMIITTLPLYKGLYELSKLIYVFEINTSYTSRRECHILKVQITREKIVTMYGDLL